MGQLGDDDEKKSKQMEDESKIDLSDTEMTIPFDNEVFSPLHLHGVEVEEDADGLQYLQNTLPVEDTFPFGDAFETQMVDFVDETQVVDILDETQVVDIGGETQVLDDFDAEVQIDSDGEESDKTEVLSDTEKLADDDSARKDSNLSVDLENVQDIALSKPSDSKAQSGSLSNEDHHPGSIVRGFTSIRVASMRAIGLAAHNMAIKKINNSSFSMKCDNSLEQQHDEKDKPISSRDSPKLTDELNQKHSLEEHDPRMKELGNEKTRKVSSSAVRKLFVDDVVSKIRLADDSMKSADGTGGMPQFASENGLAGLSYVDSQEPGDFSQANALDVVDKFIELNAVECDQDVAFTKSTGGKSKPVCTSSAKGTRSLAKKAAVRSIDGEKGIFNWDDDLEDEGGGEFFQKKKDLFYVNGGRKPPCPNSKNSFTIQQKRDKKKQVDSNRKQKDAVLSDSKLLSKNLRANESSKRQKSSFKKNLIEDLDEERDSATEDRLEDAGTDKDLTDKMDVGFDTQMAADAMETLKLAVNVTDHDHNDFDEGATKVRKSSSKDVADNRPSLEQRITRKRAGSSNAEVTRKSKKSRSDIKSSTELSLSSAKQSKNLRKQADAEPKKKEPERAKADLKELVTDQSENLHTVSKVVGQKKECRVPVGSVLDKIDGSHVTASAGRKSLKRHSLEWELDSVTPVARRTRGSVKASHSKGENNLNSSGVGTDASRLGDLNVRQIGQSNPGGCSNVKTFSLDCPKGRRTRSKLPLVGEEASIQYNTRSKRSKCDTASTSMDPIKHQKDRSSVTGSNGILADRIDNGSSEDKDGSNIQENVVKAQISKHSDVKRVGNNTRSAEGKKVNGTEEASPKDRFKPSTSASSTPLSCTTPRTAASPICMGDEYHKQSCRKNLLRSSLMKDISSLTSTIGLEFTSAMKDTRRRRDMTTVRAMFSLHLDGDISKQQKKILARLGASEASSISNATHFITDEFVRTRNMLESIAFGKPIVTHLWLESCGQANCFIDERNYILRDAKKEKEFGFSMPVTLARACQHPLLQGQRVLITPNTKPGKGILGSLVKAVHGLAVERLGRSALKDERLPDDILVLSCEEDYDICVPFLEKGAAVYSSELLLNGIVTQRLDYERHRLFTDNVKRTRSTIWLKKNNNQYLPVNKS
ncbi:hypothetical protein ACH5RR_031181 [Cinchona calisaya]|uniref:BRCT domain-containing protein n=1 Tax=Cinchona calisaya TaxID=153742 RepID=A0ABD2YEG2_9GENT